MNARNKIKSSSSTWLEIKKILTTCSEHDIIGLIAELYSLSEPNQDFLEARFLLNKEVLMRYKVKIKTYLAPDEPWKESQQISLRDAKKVISAYKKATNDKIGLIDLMVYYVECGTDFLCEFGDAYEQYYISLESMFENTLKIMKQLGPQKVKPFVKRLRLVVNKAEHTGWGYHDAIYNMADMMEETYPN